jgi:hypothetical protein
MIMMRFILVTLLFPLYSSAQSFAGRQTTVSVQGTIQMPSMVSINVISAIQSISINSFEEITSGKIYPSFFQLHVKSNKAWTVSAMTNAQHLSSITTAGIQKIPANILSLKAEPGNDFVHLSNQPVALFHNVNNQIENTYKVDLKIDGLLNYYGGDYTYNIIFIVSAR